LGEILLHLGLIAFFREHFFSEEFSDEAGEARIFFCRPDSCPSSDIFIESNSYVSHDTKLV